MMFIINNFNHSHNLRLYDFCNSGSDYDGNMGTFNSNMQIKINFAICNIEIRHFVSFWDGTVFDGLTWCF